MTSDLEVDATGLRAWATALSAIGARVSADPPPAPPDPGWSAADAAIALGDAVQQQVRRLADAIGAAARQASAAADDYEDADARAAARLRIIR